MSPPMDDKPERHITVYVCTNLRVSGSSCAGHKSKAILRALERRADERVVEGHALVHVRPSVCMGYCGDGPNVKIIGGDFFHRVKMDDLDTILDAAEHLIAAKDPA
ncbi:hypothetical protein BEN30_03670 [Magnetovibrio blakemorei]|uniref:Ferredoxin n=2 Tax=Magnetovibrio blakemorei TaxID=28181 RepID=A0A1E5QB73_9PROT|nr:hypothetical protein BEN30_03670 [Magnetovibrio blakemorei]